MGEPMPLTMDVLLEKLLSGELDITDAVLMKDFGAVRADFTVRVTKKCSEIARALDNEQLRWVVRWVYDRETLREMLVNLFAIAIRRKITAAFAGFKPFGTAK